MSDEVFLVDIHSGDNTLRCVTGEVEGIRRLLEADGVEDDLQFLRVERIKDIGALCNARK